MVHRFRSKGDGIMSVRKKKNVEIEIIFDSVKPNHFPDDHSCWRTVRHIFLNMSLWKLRQIRSLFEASKRQKNI